MSTLDAGWHPTAAEQERLLAFIFVPDPAWVEALMWVLLTVPGCGPLGDRLRHWRTRRAVRLYRERPSTPALPGPLADEDADDDGACPDDPGGQHHIGCGCEDSDVLS